MVISAKCIFWWNKRHACHFGGGPSLNTWSSWAWINSVTSELRQPCTGYKSICYVNFKVILCNLQDLKSCQWLNYTETKDYLPCHPRKGRRYNWCCCLTVWKVFFLFNMVLGTFALPGRSGLQNYLPLQLPCFTCKNPAMGKKVTSGWSALMTHSFPLSFKRSHITFSTL